MCLLTWKDKKCKIKVHEIFKKEVKCEGGQYSLDAKFTCRGFFPKDTKDPLNIKVIKGKNCKNEDS